MSNGAAPPRWPLLLALLMLLAALATLLWLRDRLLASQQAELSRAVRLFESTGVLGRPESRTLVFADLETNARASESELIRRLYVVKRTTDGDELLVHPFFVELANPQWKTEAEWTILPVGGEPPVGWLYAEIDRTALRVVDSVIAVIGLLMAVGLGVLLIRQRGKEQQLSRAIGELEERKVQVIQLERLALAGQLSANVFHDIRKPVLNIKHEVDDALDGPLENPATILQSVKAQTELFLQMLRDLGMESFVNVRQEETEWCDLREAIERSLRLVRYEQDSVDVVTELPEQFDYLIEAVPHRLVQLFSNLILNAYQAMEGRGTLRIAALKQRETLAITIEDSGPGVPEEFRENIFSPFVTSREASGGSGLGLYIAQTIARDMGGELLVDQSPTLGGARFTLQLAGSLGSAESSKRAQ
jgi:signal transduction histidine kinase